MNNFRFRVGTTLAFTGLILSFALSWILMDPVPFTSVGTIAVLGKWGENITERLNGYGKKNQEEDDKLCPCKQ